jgi:hypothetical protein
MSAAEVKDEGILFGRHDWRIRDGRVRVEKIMRTDFKVEVFRERKKALLAQRAATNDGYTTAANTRNT